MPTGRLIATVFLLPCLLHVALCTLPGQAVGATQAVAAAVTGETSHVEEVRQTGATATKAKVGQILGDLLILSLYGFPLSIAEGWVLADPTKTKKQPKTESSESLEATETPDKPPRKIHDKAPASSDDWATWLERLADWGSRLQGVPGGLVAGGCLTAAVVVVGAAAFALYFLVSGQPEKVSQIVPRFAYWLPFGLLGLITDVPFQVFDWEDRRLRIMLRLLLWWLPRLAIFAFVFNPPVLQDLDPAKTALAVLVVDGILAAFFLWLRSSQEQRGTKKA